MNPTRRYVLTSGAAAAAGAALAPLGSAAAAAGTFTPEQFGAKGDGVTNDTRAFAALSAAVNAAGGGTVELRRTTYIVGMQTPTRAQYTFSPMEIMSFNGCSRPLIVRGNGATLRCAPGLRYGTFDTAGRPTRHKLPFYGPEVASPYAWMIMADGCSGGVEISDLELDGNLSKLQIGGEYGDHGRQIPANGIGLFNNRGGEAVRNVHSHHHALDGLMINGLDEAISPQPRRVIQGVRLEYNGRQGCSIIGGRGYVFENCKFNHTGRAGLMTAPGAGVDVEAEGRRNRDFSFTDCEFSNNAGCGFLADSGDSEAMTLTRCTFVGTTAWSAWPFKPRIRFHSCRFIGAIVRAYGNDDPKRAAQFYDCTFLDDPALSPTGKVYVGDKGYGPIADLSDSKNVLFSRCTFRLTHNGLLPWSWYAIYSDVTMQQRSRELAYPKGTYLGRSTIVGNVDLYGNKVVGRLTVNGR